ncbi:MAG: hypothetical protein IT308_03355 [Anaerolineaceae bacterium]|nr:hypothetical protein [Anaerolineaceae bacterium]
MDTIPFRFIGEPVEVIFDRPPALEKKPDPPSAFRWGGETYRILQVLSEWKDFSRRGKMARTMQPQHAEHAAIHGSRGVGRYIFRVVVTGGRIFELYYDRAPANVDKTKGGWFLLGERKELWQMDEGNP